MTNPPVASADLLDRLPIGLIAVTAEGLVRWANRGAAAVGAWQVEEIIGRPIGRLLPALTGETWERHQAALMVSGNRALAGAVLTRDGRQIPADQWWIADADGRSFCILRDVSADRDLSDRLQERDAQLRTVIDHAPLVLFSLSPEGTFTLSEGAGLAALRLSPGEVVGRRALEVYASWPDVVETIERSLAGEEIWVCHSLLDRHYECRYVPTRDRTGAVSSVLGVSLDITDTVAAQRQGFRRERQLLRAQRLETAGRLAHGIAHDFNNVLTTIIGHADVLERLALGHERAESAISSILHAAERGASLVRQLQAFARDDDDARGSCDLATRLPQLAPLLAPVLGEAIKLEISCEDSPLVVPLSGAQLEQIILNLAVNARDAMSSGRLRLSATRQVTEGRIWVALIVADTGRGMAPEVLVRCTDPFFTTKAKGRGSGLGLPSVEALATRVGGHLRISSTPGRGTEVCVLLPAQTSAAATDADVRSPRPFVVGGTETVLLTEDDPALRSLIAERLGDLGYRVLTACDGSEALRVSMAQRQVFDILITDLVMPRMGGRELANLLTRLRPGLRVLFMSGWSEEPMSSLPKGHAYLAKPFSLDELAARLRGLLDAP